MKHYCERDIVGMDEVGNHYSNHVSAMTAEGLHSKSDIAAELGYRDMVIDELVAMLKKFSVKRGNFEYNDGSEHIGDEVDELLERVKS